jgi:7-cyano-7-deazaguanine reductase
MDIPLGKPTDYVETYAPELLAPMSRAAAREAIGLSGPLPFGGEDTWNGYEFSWLGPRGAPTAAALRFTIEADSPNFVESKSLKLYLNAFAQTRFSDWEAVASILRRDLTEGFGRAVKLRLLPLAALPAADDRLPGLCLDALDAEIRCFDRSPALLAHDVSGQFVTDQAWHTHLFRSLCPVTGQPDWASVLIRYSGPAIDAVALWRYLISYRRHPAFHETTIEQIFLDLKQRCGCTALLVAGFFQRRGGLDINPLRADAAFPSLHYRLPRQ